MRKRTARDVDLALGARGTHGAFPVILRAKSAVEMRLPPGLAEGAFAYAVFRPRPVVKLFQIAHRFASRAGRPLGAWFFL